MRIIWEFAKVDCSIVVLMSSQVSIYYKMGKFQERALSFKISVDQTLKVPSEVILFCCVSKHQTFRRQRGGHARFSATTQQINIILVLNLWILVS